MTSIHACLIFAISCFFGAVRSYEDPSILHINATDPLKYMSYKCKIFSATYFHMFASHFTAHNRTNPGTYSPNMNCMKLITAERGQRVIVDFPSGYDIEEAEDCKYDWLIFQDGPFFFSPIINKLCGSQDNMTSINSTGRYMRLWFRTDDFIENSGFRLNIRYEPIPDYGTNKQAFAECYYHIVFDGQSRLNISKDYISSFYTNHRKMENIDCVWDIQSLKGDLDHLENNLLFTDSFNIKRNTGLIWLWIEEAIQPNVLSCDDRTIQVFPTSERLYEDLKPMPTSSSPCYIVNTKLFPDSSRVLLHIKAKDKKAMPTINFNFTSFIQPGSRPDMLCNDSWAWTCEDGRLCLDRSLVCNKFFNCPDGDDESDEACEWKDGHAMGLQAIFIGAAVMFFLIVTAAIVLSARRMINQTLQYNQNKRKSTVIANKPFKLLEQTTIRHLLGSDNGSNIYSPHQQAGDAHSLCSHGPRSNHCHHSHSKRNSMLSKRGSWFFGNGSVSNLSLESEPRATVQSNSHAVSPIGFLSPDSYTNAIEMKRLRAASAST